MMNTMKKDLMLITLEFGRYEFLNSVTMMGIVKDGINTNGVS